MPKLEQMKLQTGIDCLAELYCSANFVLQQSSAGPKTVNLSQFVRRYAALPGAQDVLIYSDTLD